MISLVDAAPRSEHGKVIVQHHGRRLFPRISPVQLCGDVFFYFHQYLVLVIQRKCPPRLITWMRAREGSLRGALLECLKNLPIKLSPTVPRGQARLELSPELLSPRALRMAEGLEKDRKPRPLQELQLSPKTKEFAPGAKQLWPELSVRVARAFPAL